MDFPAPGDFFNRLKPVNETATTIEYSHLINWAFYSMLTMLVGGMLKCLHVLVKNVIQLNTQIASIIEKVVFHEKKLEEHANRIQYLERKK